MISFELSWTQRIRGTWSQVLTKLHITVRAYYCPTSPYWSYSHSGHFPLTSHSGCETLETDEVSVGARRWMRYWTRSPSLSFHQINKLVDELVRICKRVKKAKQGYSVWTEDLIHNVEGKAPPLPSPHCKHYGNVGRASVRFTLNIKVKVRAPELTSHF